MNARDLILIVEDDDNLRYLVTHQLRKLGYIAHYATTGEEAVRMVKQHRYKLILMDVMMPVLDGIEATSQIRLVEQQEGHSHTPIIAMTAFHDQARCAEAGMDDYLFKPVLLEDLQKKLDAWLPPDETTGDEKSMG